LCDKILRKFVAKFFRERGEVVRYLTAGESHGPQLTVIIEGLPSQLPFSREKGDEQLARRQKG